MPLHLHEVLQGDGGGEQGGVGGEVGVGHCPGRASAVRTDTESVVQACFIEVGSAPGTAQVVHWLSGGADAGCSDATPNPFYFYHDNKYAKGYIYYDPGQAVVKSFLGFDRHPTIG